MRLASLAQRSCAAATNSMRTAALSTTFEPALLKRVKNFSLLGCIHRPMGRSSWADVPPCAPPLREEVVRPQRTIGGNENTHSPPLSIYTAQGGLRQAPGRAA